MTWCVFGIAKEQCIKKAEKQMPNANIVTAKWVDARNEIAAKLWDEETRLYQISGEFDAPQFARDFIETAKKTDSARDCKIMVRQAKIDKQSEPILRKGKRVATWAEWNDEDLEDGARGLVIERQLKFGLFV